MVKSIKKSVICCVCGLYSKSFLCDRHRRSYIYHKERDFITLKPRRKVSKPQTELFKRAREIFKKPCFQEAIFPFLLFYRFDIVIPDKKVILEYSGEQHYKYIKFFHKTKKNFKKRQEIDVFKRKIVKEHGYKLIDFNFKEDMKDVEYIKRKLKSKGCFK